ncbi:hypothetical protein RVS70_07365 [Virgibacillus sp. M23]|uniref:hypothetical protein n=1 Tax=Virgibacillus sp. M23 TaxID=3079030 RepID=UPI002A90BC5D|nr:hypothetical protein [Virgibacillus sp. M23]MDY7044023.1 hypothetical protein [Virgibacillus sp. M23]
MKGILFSIMSLLIITGCSSETILKTGEQIDESTVKFNNEITNKEEIEKVKKILDQMEKTNIKDIPEDYPDTVLLIQNSDENYNELNISIWYNDNNTLIHTGMVDYKEGNFYKLENNQSDKLKEILKNN